ncbi:MAG TPA: tail fiber domain-containing protein [Verrucomicrobiae bacterium]
MKKIITFAAVAATTLRAIMAATTVTGDEATIGLWNSITTPALQYNSIPGGGWNTIAKGTHASAQTPWYEMIAGGSFNTIKSQGYLVTAGGVQTVLGDHQAINQNSAILGGAYNTILDCAQSTIAGGLGNTLEPWVHHSFIGGGHNNIIRYGSGYSVISGGTDNSVDRLAWWGSINGGQNNHISGALPTANTYVLTNVASGSLVIGRLYYVEATGGGTITPTGGAALSNGQTFTATATTYSSSGNAFVKDGYEFRHYGWIGGGLANVITNKGASHYSGRGAAIGGGIENLVSGHVGTISGGWTNGVAGDFATVPGGSWNHADGINSFAAGRHAHADHNGSFAWGDYHPTWDGTATQDVKSWASNTFAARATGGFWFGGMGSVYPHATNLSGRFINTSTGAYLSDTGVWSNNSDKALKENFENVNTREILKKVAALNITKWNYKVEGNKEVRHVGPVAQDFSAAFGVGQSDRHISTIDGDGIALAAIQGLNQIVEEKDALLSAQSKQIQLLEDRLKEIERRLSN